jgi:hypothetical protein
MVNEFKKYCTSNEMDETKDEEEVQNVGSEYESMSFEFDTEYGTVKTMKLIQARGTVNRSRLAKLNKG